MDSMDSIDFMDPMHSIEIINSPMEATHSIDYNSIGAPGCAP